MAEVLLGCRWIYASGGKPLATSGLGCVALAAALLSPVALQAATPVYPTNTCVASKLRASARYCSKVANAWAAFETNQDSAKRDTRILAANASLAKKWLAAEDKASSRGVDCAETTLASPAMASWIQAQVTALVGQVNNGLNLSSPAEARCGRALLRAAAARCAAFLRAEASHLTKLAKDPQGLERSSKRAKAANRFAAAFTKATQTGCPTQATQNDLESALDDLSDSVLERSIVSPSVSDTQFDVVAPVGPIAYQGETLEPRCAFDTPYYFFARRGSVNKLLIYYQGGGACWNSTTCGFLQTFDPNVNPSGSDNPNNGPFTGFADPNNPANPFRDWHVVFVPYCTGDLHFGDAEPTYPGSPNVHILHRGYQNARTVEKWAREHFVNPSEIFVTGTSAGAYGALFNAPLHHFVWPASQFSVLGDAGNGVITTNFLLNEFPNWNFVAHIPPNIPGISAALSGGGLPAYLQAVAAFFPATAWAHYTTAYDGGQFGPTGFYQVMLNPNNVFVWPNWWNATCAWNQAMIQQAQATYAAAPQNYRYYIGAGSRHGVFHLNKVYNEQSGGESMTVADWVQAMVTRSPSWVNVTCTDCGRILAGDPVPSPLASPFVADSGTPSGVRVSCP